MDLVAFSVAVGTGFAVLVGTALTVARFLKHVPQGQVMIVNSMQPQPRVVFTSAIVLPIVNRAELMDLTRKTLTLERQLACADGLQLELKMNFLIRVNPTVEDVLKVATAVGCARAGELGALNELFEPRFTEALKTVAGRMRLGEITDDRDRFRYRVLETIGTDLSGYRIDEAVIVTLRRAPVAQATA